MGMVRGSRKPGIGWWGRRAAAAGVAAFSWFAPVGPAGATVALSGAASSGSVTGFGDARPYGAPAPDQLRSPTVAIAATPDGRGYWLMGADGGVFAYGDAGFYGSGAGSGVMTPFVGMAATPDGRGY